MFRSLSPRWRRLVSSLAYSALVGLVVVLGYLTFEAVSRRRQGGDQVAEQQAPAPLFEIANFWARQEKSAEAERLTVSMRLRLTAPGTVDGYVYVVARNDHVSPRLWAVWPSQGTGGTVTAGGHLRTEDPSTGHEVTLTEGWTRISATLDHPPGRPPFDTVYIYVVSPKGEILLSRPFAL